MTFYFPPWTFRQTKTDCIISSGEETIGFILNPSHAKLVAAAPELLEAASEYIRVLPGGIIGDRLRNAIANAIT